jgi:hypothetical protein
MDLTRMCLLVASVLLVFAGLPLTGLCFAAVALFS